MESESFGDRKGESKSFNIRHRCFYFSKKVILFVQDSKFEWMYRSIYSQLIRSSTSIGANLVGGRAGRTKRDWVNYYVIGLKSANETKYWLCLIRDTLPVNNCKMEELIKEADEISKIIASIIINAEKE